MPRRKEETFPELLFAMFRNMPWWVGPRNGAGRGGCRNAGGGIVGVGIGFVDDVAFDLPPGMGDDVEARRHGVASGV